MLQEGRRTGVGAPAARQNWNFYTKSRSGGVARQVRIERDRVVVFVVARAEDERHASPARRADERGDRRLFRIELLGVALLELEPARGIVVEPAPQPHA